MPELTKTSPRIDVEIYNESCALFVSNAKVRDVFERDDAYTAKRAVADHQLIAVGLDQDDGFVARVVLGELTAQEEAEWIGRGSRKLDLSDGQLVVAGGASYVSEGLDDEFFAVIDVPPGEYFVTVDHQLPFVNGFRITRLPEWNGFVPYYRKTRSATGRLPDWLADFADLEGEELDEDDESHDEDVEMVAFVIRLQAVTPQSRESLLEDDGFLTAEWRIPVKCPLGIEPVGIERPDVMTDEEQAAMEAAGRAAHEARFSDDAGLAERFRPLATAVHMERYDEAATYFVPSLRDRVAEYLETEIQQARENAQTGEDLPTVPEVNNVWRDGEPAETTLPRWTNSSADGDNLFDTDAIDAEHYLGEVRCEFGDSTAYTQGVIDLYFFVDVIAVATEDGPLLAGVAVY